MNKNTTITKIEELETGKFYVPTRGSYAVRYDGIDHQGKARVTTSGGVSSEASAYLPAFPATAEEIADFEETRDQREKTLSAYYAEKARTGGYSGD
jgi:hypothetical protein